MMHRFVDLLETPLGSPPYVILENGSGANTWNIWRVIDGIPTRLTSYADPTFSEVQGNPRLSPNGQWVAYQEIFPGSGGSGVIDMVPANGGSVTRLFDSGDGDYALYPSWHPDSDLVVFTGGGFVGAREGAVKTVTVPGGTVATLWAPAEDEEGAFRPKFSPDGTQIAFLVNVSPGGSGLTRQGLWVMDADGSNDSLIRAFGTAVTNGGYTFAGDGPHIAWSNDGEWIAFVEAYNNSTATFNLSKIRPDGSDETLLATGRPPASRQWRIAEDAWAPDDSFLIALLDGSGWGIHRVEADGSGTTEIVDGSTESVGIQIVRHPQNNRVYWKSNDLTNLIRSSAIDGTDVVTEHEMSGVSSSDSSTGFFIDPV